MQTHEGLPLMTGQGDDKVFTKKVHVFGEQWALHRDDYEAVTFKRPLLSLASDWVRTK